MIFSLFLYFRYKSRGCKASKAKSGTFYVLLDLMYFFDLYHSEQYDLALEVRFFIFLYDNSYKITFLMHWFEQCSLIYEDDFMY